MQQLGKAARSVRKWIDLVVASLVCLVSTFLFILPLGCPAPVVPIIEVYAPDQPYDIRLPPDSTGPFYVKVTDSAAVGRDSARVLLKLLAWAPPQRRGTVETFLSDSEKQRAASLPGGYYDTLYFRDSIVPARVLQLVGTYYDGDSFLDNHRVLYVNFGFEPQPLEEEREPGLYIWSGNHTYGSKGDSIRPYRAYDIWVQVVGEDGWPADGEAVSFTVPAIHQLDGEVKPTSSTTARTWVTGAETGWHGRHSGLAGTALTFAGNAKESCLVKAEWQNLPECTVNFTVHVVDDQESPIESLDVGKLWEERPYGCVVRGDGLWGSDDPDGENLDLLVELDWDDDIIKYDEISQAIDSVKHIYSKIGINVDVVLDEMHTPFPLEFLSKQAIRCTLAAHRNEALKGLGRGHVHGIVAGNLDEGWMLNGTTVSYCHEVTPSLAASWSVPTQWHYGSNARLDSCGILVFERGLRETSDEWSKARLCAYVLAHELGHAIGLNHIFDSTNVMFDPFRPLHQDWDEMTRFIFNTDLYCFINLRRILGREVVSQYWIWTVE